MDTSISLTVLAHDRLRADLLAGHWQPGQKLLMHQQWEEELVLAFHRLSRTPRSVQPDSYEENPSWERLHRAFHFALLQACDSPLLLGFCEQLYDQAYRYRQLSAHKAYKRRNELDEHQAMFDAAMGNHLEEARRLMAAHYERTASFFSDAA